MSISLASQQQPENYTLTDHILNMGLEKVSFFITPNGDTIPKLYRLLFLCTNNVAEYEPMLISIKLAVEWKVTELHVYGDSQLVINQENDEYQTKEEKLIPYKRMVDDFKEYFVVISFE